ncbi:MAG: hypothetical protein ACLTSK_05940 [Christensenellales bacterium]
MTIPRGSGCRRNGCGCDNRSFLRLRNKPVCRNDRTDCGCCVCACFALPLQFAF